VIDCCRRNARLRASVASGFTLEYWQDGDWYVGKVNELPGVFSQGRTVEELTANVQDACVMMGYPRLTTVDRRLRTEN
jgi:predicted RNase H-like HicB family nuclease